MMTDSKGRRMYGICLRGLFKGVNKRFDVGRRRRHCLCIITAHPFFSMFRAMLLQLHSLALLDRSDGPKSLRCWRFLEAVYDQSFSQPLRSLSVSWDCHPELPMQRDFCLVPPLSARGGLRDMRVLPLLEVLGVDRFFRLLSAILCERRIIFVAEEAELLSGCVIAAASLVAPFQWQHIFIPLLPSQLLAYVAAPTPYIYGIRRYLLPELKKQLAADLRSSSEGVLVVDLQAGDLQAFGAVDIVDFVGDSATALKQASDSLDRVKQAANSFLGTRDGNREERDRDRDLMAMIIADLRAAISNRPGSAAASLQSVAGLLRGGSGARSAEEGRVEWALQAEKAVRDALAVFFVYLFGDLADFVTSPKKAVGSGPGRKKESSVVDLQAFRQRRAALGDSRPLQDFLVQFSQSQMFERYCAQLSQAPADSDEDLFGAALRLLRLRQLPATTSAVRQAVAMASGKGADGQPVSFGGHFHPLTLTYTAPGDPPDPDLLQAPSPPSSWPGKDPALAGSGAVERILADSGRSDLLLRVLRTLAFRLEACAGAGPGCRGSAGVSGRRALSLLRSLLVGGADAVLSHSLDLVPLLLRLLKLCDPSLGPAAPASVLDLVAFSGSPASSAAALHSLAGSVLSLLLDHGRLQVQRRHRALRKEEFRLSQPSPSPSLKRQQLELLSIVSQAGSGRGQGFPAFSRLHESLGSGMQQVRALRREGCLRLSQDTSNSSISSATSSSGKELSSSEGAGDLLLLGDTLPDHNNTSNKTNDSLHSHSSKSSNKDSSSKTSDSVDLLDLSSSSFVVPDEARFRLVNQDTGEVMDIRDLDRVAALSLRDGRRLSRDGQAGRTTDPFSLPPGVAFPCPKTEFVSEDFFATQPTSRPQHLPVHQQFASTPLYPQHSLGQQQYLPPPPAWGSPSSSYHPQAPPPYTGNTRPAAVNYSTQRPQNGTVKVPAAGINAKQVQQSNAPKDPFSDLVSFKK